MPFPAIHPLVSAGAIRIARNESRREMSELHRADCAAKERACPAEKKTASVPNSRPWCENV